MDAGCAKTFEPDPVTAISQLTCDNSADCHTIRVDATLAQEYTFNLKVTVWGVVHTSTNQITLKVTCITMETFDNRWQWTSEQTRYFPLWGENAVF